MGQLSKRNRIPAARILLGSHPGQAIVIHAYTAHELGIPTVEVVGDIEGLWFMKPETAEEIAHGLLRAAQLARGEQAPEVISGEVRGVPANEN